MIYVGLYFLVSLVAVILFYNVVKDLSPQEALGDENVTVNHVQALIFVLSLLWPLTLLLIIFMGLKLKGNNE